MLKFWGATFGLGALMAYAGYQPSLTPVASQPTPVANQQNQTEMNHANTWYVANQQCVDVYNAFRPDGLNTRFYSPYEYVMGVARFLDPKASIERLSDSNEIAVGYRIDFSFKDKPDFLMFTSDLSFCHQILKQYQKDE